MSTSNQQTGTEQEGIGRGGLVAERGLHEAHAHAGVGGTLPRSPVDLLSEDVLVDPHPTYRDLRRAGPVVWLERSEMAALSRYAPVQAALLDWRSFSSASGIGFDDAADQVQPPNITASDPPEHSGFRRALTRQLSSRRLTPAALQVQRTAEHAANRVVERGTFDAVDDLARPYSVAVVGDLVGIQQEDLADVADLSERAFHVFGSAHGRLPEGLAAEGQLVERALGLAASGRLCPGGAGDELAKAGEGVQILSYLWPGVHTTSNAVSAAIHLFARHPKQWDLVREDASLIPGALDEVLRLHAPVSFFTRRTTRAIDVEAFSLPADVRVLLMFGSANRDERHYDDPDRFDVTRPVGDHLAFGHGVHLCVGMNLARLEVHALLGALARRVRRFEPLGEPRWMVNSTLHGLAALPVPAIAA